MALDYTEIDKIIDNAPSSAQNKEYFEELKANFEELETSPVLFQHGIDTLTGTTAVRITLAPAFPDDLYHVSVTPRDTALVGKIIVHSFTKNYFEVKSSSGDDVQDFSWAAFGE